ncbi:MAG: hypothetical protein H7144_02715 [Burkholderiales bacterium]|nr:hypothetical protein [Phycisphaerae bacterium]
MKSKNMPCSGAGIESLERRVLLASVLSGTNLIITGTDAADTLGLAIRGSRLRVGLNGILKTYTPESVTRIDINTLDGNDVVDWSAISIPTYINAGAGHDSVTGGSGIDTLTGAAGRDTLRAGAGDDRINGGNHADQLFGDAGRDVIYGGAADDYLDGGADVDWLFGEADADRLIGGHGNDRIYGGDGADRMYGVGHHDLLSGEGGNDRLYGGVGNDQLYGGGGRDQLFGEAGDDKHYAKDSIADAVDGGDGADWAQVDGTLDNVATVETVEGLQASTAKFARAISFNDESLWDANFATALQQIKDLGVQAVRLWLNVDDYNERPKAWDPVNERDIVATWQGGDAGARVKIGGLAMKRAFALKRAGIAVLVTVTRFNGTPPSSADEVKNYFKHLLTSTETETSTKPFKDVVDYWEIGNEVDHPTMWQPSVNKTAGLQAYVDQLLLPVSEVLHSGTPATWERVVSASVRYSPSDLSVILKQLKTRNRMDAIDFAGFHPYGLYDPTKPGVNEIKDRTLAAVALGEQYGKKIIATEWNVRGFPYDSSRNSTWAQAIDDIYRDVILPNYEIGFYFNLTNNFAARGGNTSARPAGLLKHNTTIQITPSSSVEDKLAYFHSPLVAAEPFYSTFNAWKTIEI